MIDIEMASLGPLEEDFPALLHLLVQDDGGIGDIWSAGDPHKPDIR